MEDTKCARSISAAMEIISESVEECGGQFVRIDDMDIVIWVPKGELEYSPHSPETSEERKEAIEACMEGRWSREWQESITGPGVSEDVARRTRKKLCEGLYD